MEVTRRPHPSLSQSLSRACCSLVEHHHYAALSESISESLSTLLLPRRAPSLRCSIRVYLRVFLEPAAPSSSIIPTRLYPSLCPSLSHDVFFFRNPFTLFRNLFSLFRNTPLISRHTPPLFSPPFYNSRAFFSPKRHQPFGSDPGVPSDPPRPPPIRPGPASTPPIHPAPPRPAQPRLP